MIDPRDLLVFPQGDNSTDIVVSGVHWNLTTLQHYNYTYYSNGTFSNRSRCLLVFEPYTPLTILPNGTFLNSTSCYSPIMPMTARAKTGLFFACFFALSIMLTFINLRKHGKLFLPVEKRFRAVGRRWQWYWTLVVATFGIISSITGVDVDRYYLPELPIVLSTFFWFLMLPCTMSAVWESVRNWGSWQERQMIDPDPFMLRQDDRRAKVEFYLPLLFYFFVWMNFFLVVPRSWTKIEYQRDPEQTLHYAQPSATDIRFKLAAFFLFASWLTTAYSLHYSIMHYKPRNHGIVNRAFGFIRYTPWKFMLVLPVSLMMIGYEAACAFDFSISPLNLHPNLGLMYGLGWGTISFTVLVLQIVGYMDPNEDQELIRQRRVRGDEIDSDMGVTKKPHWWFRLNGDNTTTGVHDQIARNVTEVGGSQAPSRNVESCIEMVNMQVSKRENSEQCTGGVQTDVLAATLLFPAQTDVPETKERFTDHPENSKGRRTNNGHTLLTGTNERSNSHRSSASSITLGAKPQIIRSMLDV